MKNTWACALATATLAGCGGGGGASDNQGMPMQQQTGPSQTYLEIGSVAVATSDLTGAVADSGTGVSSTTGTISHNTQSFTASGLTGPQSLGATSQFNFASYDYATDVQISPSVFAIVGVGTAVADMRSTGSVNYTGEFQGNLVDTSAIAATPLDWSADVQANFAGGGDVDMTFAGGGSTLIDEIRIQNATISGNTLSGGTITTSMGGVTNNITGTAVDMDGAFFGYDDTLGAPAEVGGALTTSDADSALIGAFIASTQP